MRKQKSEQEILDDAILWVDSDVEDYGKDMDTAIGCVAITLGIAEQVLKEAYFNYRNF